MRPLVSHRAVREVRGRGSARWWGLTILCLVLASSAAWAQQATPASPSSGRVDPAPAAAPEVAPPAEPAAPAVPAVPAPPPRERADDEALDRIDRVLDEVEEQIEEGIEDGEDARIEAIRERRERIREIREQVHERIDDSDNKVSFGSSIHVTEGEVARDVVAIGGSVDVAGDVEGDVVAIGGPVSINGKVTGDVVSVGASVHLGDEAEVLGEVTSVGGAVHRAPGAKVVGRINEVALGPNFSWNVGDADIRWWDWRPRHRDLTPWSFGWFGFGLSMIAFVVLVVVTLLTRLIAGGTVERVRAKAVEAPWLCALVGLAIEVLIVPVLVVVTLILVVTIIGIPLILLLPFVVLAFLLALLVGYTGVAQAVGEWIGGRFGRAMSGPYLSLITGVFLIQILHLIAEFLDSFDGVLWFFAFMFGVAGVFVRWLAWTVGLGAVFLTTVRRYGAGAVAVPPPPPPAGYTPDPTYLPPEPPDSGSM